MVKPSPNPSPSRLRSKRRKLSADQPTLETFFSDAFPAVRTPRKGSPTNKRDQERNDERLASRLAVQDGFDLETMRDLEVGWKQNLKMQSTAAEIIDVDVLTKSQNTKITGPGPSRVASEVLLATPEDNLRQSIFNAPGETSSGVHLRAAFSTDITKPPVYKSLAHDTLTYGLEDVPWPIETAAPYSFLAHTLVTLSRTRSRIIIVNTLTNALRTIIRFHPPSLLPALYLLSNTLSPPYQSLELGLGPSIISKAIQHVSGITPQALRRLYHGTGDPGDVAFEAKSNLRTLVPHSPLLIQQVYSSLLKIAQSKGTGAARQKQAIVETLLLAAQGEEVRFLTRTLSQNIRVGAVRTSILVALARAMVLTPPLTLRTVPASDSLYHAPATLISQVKPLQAGSSNKKTSDSARDKINAMFSRAESLIKKVYVQHPNYSRIVGALLEVGLEGLSERVPLTVGIPLHPTLGLPTRSLEEIYTRLGDRAFTAEFKYDGQRAQIHASRTHHGQISVRIFSRHLEDMTSKYPDIVLLCNILFHDTPEMESFIVDSEIVAINPADESLRSFQELSSRARKDVVLHTVKIPVAVFVFDLMYLDGKVLLEDPFRTRRTLLRDRFPPLTPIDKDAALLRHVQSCESEDGREAIEYFWEQAIESQCEGFMVKLLDHGKTQPASARRQKSLPASYEPDKRTAAWLKLKKDYVDGLGDSLDLVPIGAWHGNGRKAQWWSPILLAIYDSSSGKHVAVCKCMSGFTDAFYKSLMQRYPEDSDNCSRQPLWGCDAGGFSPDVYFRPREVWEIRGADITVSPASIAALGMISSSRGLSLRFPRFMRVKGDKTVDQASTPEFLVNMYRSQQVVEKRGAGADDGELLDIDVEGDVEGTSDPDSESD